jgi:hypothetical protein
MVNGFGVIRRRQPVNEGLFCLRCQNYELRPSYVKGMYSHRDAESRSFSPSPLILLRSLLYQRSVELIF